MHDSVVLRGLEVRSGGTVLVQGVGFELLPGRVVGLVGASGSGKTLSARALLGLVDLDPGVVTGELVVRVEERRWAPYQGLPMPPWARDRAFRPLRGSVLGYVPQDAPRTLDPLSRVGVQLRRAARLGAREATPVARWLGRAGFDPSEADAVAALYPHELSGGMAQRVAIAVALARGSRFLVADEPTTGVDADVQHQLVELLQELAADGLGVLLVTHDLRWLGEVAHQVHVLDGGRLVETLDGQALRDGQGTSEAGRRLLAAVEDLSSPGFP